jgi:GTPase SAR1 family protein
VYGSAANKWFDPWFSLEGISYYLDDQEKTFNIAVFGPSGSGKSRLINMMFNRQICDTKVSLNSVTRDIHFIRGKGIIGNGPQLRDVVVADTIGLCDTVFSEEETMAIIKDRISSNVTKLHAVYLVLSSKRCFQEFKTNLENILKWLKYDQKDNRFFFRFVVTHCEGEPEDDLKRIRGEARAILGLKDTTFDVYHGSKKLPKKLEQMICCGFPNESILGEDGKKGVRESMRRLKSLIKASVVDTKTRNELYLDIPREEKGVCNIL